MLRKSIPRGTESVTGNGGASGTVRAGLPVSENLKVACPVVGVRVLLRDVEVIKRSLKRPPAREKEPGDVTGEYTADSAASLRRTANNCGVRWTALLLLTYGRDFPRCGQQAKLHLDRFLSSMREKWPGCAYIWVREYQERGAPHWHIAVDIPLGKLETRWRRKAGRHVEIDVDKDRWLGRVWRKAIGHEYPKSEKRLITSWEVLRDIDGGAKYLSVYASKLRQKTLPVFISRPGAWWRSSRNVVVRPTALLSVDDRELARIMQGAEKAWNGETYATLHGAAEVFNEHDIHAGIVERVLPSGRVRARHRAGCQCRLCGGGSSPGSLCAPALAEAMADAQGDAATSMHVNWWLQTAPLERCAWRRENPHAWRTPTHMRVYTTTGPLGAVFRLPND